MRALLLALCLGACRQRPAPVLVDGTLPFGSHEGLMARFVREGYDLAFEEAGSGWRLDLTDDGGDPARGVESMRRSPARFHLGSSSPEVADAQAAFAAAEGRPYLDGLQISGEQLAISPRCTERCRMRQAPAAVRWSSSAHNWRQRTPNRLSAVSRWLSE